MLAGNFSAMTGMGDEVLKPFLQVGCSWVQLPADGTKTSQPAAIMPVADGVAAGAEGLHRLPCD